MITRYRILESTDPELLAADVGRYLAEGWSLRGDVSVIVTEPPTSKDYCADRFFWYAQVVVK